MINHQILGAPGRDNAAYVVVDSGQSISRFLFDCGYGCLDALNVSDIMSIDAAFFSHFHMDHISGFDALFRFNYNRTNGSPLMLVGPTDSRRVLQHRMQAYTWNLVDDSEASVIVREFGQGKLATSSFLTRHQFRTIENEAIDSIEDGVVLDTTEVTVSAIELDHGCGCAGYLVREANRINVDTSELSALGLRPGPWLKQITDTNGVGPDETIGVDGQSIGIGQLRDALLTETPGASLAYLD